MLYDHWRKVAGERRGERALRDVATDRSWTFGELLDWSDRASSPPAEVAYPQGQGAPFILEVLRAWRHDCCVCPLEPGQQPPGIPRPPSNIAHLKRTSATTGTARTVAFKGAQLAADPAHIVTTMGLRPDWPNLGAISLAHSYGFSNLVLPLLLHGIPLILATSALPEAIRRAAAGDTGLTLAGVPALWRAWHQADAIPGGVRLAISAGAPLSLELESAIFQQRDLKIHNFYGSSECGGIAYDCTPTPRSNRAGVGTAMIGVSLEIAGDGCLRVSGPNVGETYWPEPVATLGDGCFQTSDLAQFRGKELLLHGRASDVINVAGRKVAPETIEQVLQQHPGVVDCLVLGVPSPEEGRGEDIVACVETCGNTTANVLTRFLVERLPAWQAPRQWLFVESLTANQRGKISRAEWRAHWMREASRSV